MEFVWKVGFGWNVNEQWVNEWGRRKNEEFLVCQFFSGKDEFNREKYACVVEAFLIFLYFFAVIVVTRVLYLCSFQTKENKKIRFIFIFHNFMLYPLQSFNFHFAIQHFQIVYALKRAFACNCRQLQFYEFVVLWLFWFMEFNSIRIVIF